MEQKTNTSAFGPREHMTTLFRHRRVIFRIFITTVVVALAISLLISKVYRSEARILVQLKRAPQQLATSLTQTSEFQHSQPQDQVMTEVEIIKSMEIARRLVQEMGPEYVLENMRWRWDRLRAIPGDIKGWITDRIMELFFEPKPKSPPDPVSMASQKILGNLEAGAIIRTDIFAVSLDAPNREFAIEALNKLVHIYIDYHLELRRPLKAREVLSEEANRLKAQLKEAENRLQTVKQEWHIVSSERQKNLLLSRYSQTQTDLEDARRMELESAERIEEINNQLAKQSQSVPLSSVTQNHLTVDKLRTRILNLELQRDQYVEDSPAAKRLDKDIKNLQASLQRAKSSGSSSLKTSGLNQTYQELQKTLALERSNRQVLKSRIPLLEKNAEELGEALRVLDEREVALSNLELDVSVKRDAMKMFTRKKEEALINEAFDHKQVSNVIPVEPAQAPARAISPRKGLNLMLGIIVGLLGGIGTAYVLEYFRRTLSNREETEERLGYPVLAAVAAQDQGSKAQAANLIEYRRLAEKLMRHQAEGTNRVYLTSSMTGEGKTTVAEGLCEALSQQGGQIVLLVAVNAMHSGPDSQPETLKPGEVTTHSSDGSARGYDQLCIVGNQGHLGERLLRSLDKLSADYTSIVIDGPDMHTFPEQLNLVSKLSETIFILEANRTTSMVAARNLALLKGAGANLTGIVLNKRRYEIPDWAYRWVLSSGAPIPTGDSA